MDLDRNSHSPVVPEPHLLHPGSSGSGCYSSSSADAHGQEIGPGPTFICPEANPVASMDPLLLPVDASASGSTLSSPSQRAVRSNTSNAVSNIYSTTTNTSFSTLAARPTSTVVPSSLNATMLSTSHTTSVPVLPSHAPEQFGHCPRAREGPALGCNYCWNTTDANGRILRRKTKYQCPDCQANLCIVPCFQAYHEQLEKGKASSTQRQ